MIFDSADLFSCAGVHEISDSLGEVVVPGDAVVQGTTTSYMAVENSVFFSIGEQTVVVKHASTGNPVVIHKVFLP